MDPGNFDLPAMELWYGGRRLPTPGNKSCARQLCDGSQRRLGGIQAKPEVFIVVSGIQVRWLMPLRIRIFSRSRRVFFALKIFSLIHVRTRAIETGFFVVPEDEADRSIGLDIGGAQYAGDFHHERSAGAVVVCRFTPTVAIHVRA